MFERINKKVKGVLLFTAHENARPDVACRHHRSNGTERSRRLLGRNDRAYHSDGGDCQVCTYRGEALLCHCRCRCNCQTISVYIAMNNEEQDVKRRS